MNQKERLTRGWGYYRFSFFTIPLLLRAFIILACDCAKKSARAHPRYLIRYLRNKIMVERSRFPLLQKEAGSAAEEVGPAWAGVQPQKEGGRRGGPRGGQRTRPDSLRTRHHAARGGSQVITEPLACSRDFLRQMTLVSYSVECCSTGNGRLIFGSILEISLLQMFTSLEYSS